DDGTTSKRELEAAEADEARLTALADQKTSDLTAAQQMLQVIGRQVEEAQQAVKTKQAALDLANIDLGYTRIVAPVPGPLSRRRPAAARDVGARQRLGRGRAAAAERPVRVPFRSPPPGPPLAPTPITRNTWLASLAAFSAAWMVVMATRYFALQAGDVNGGL